MADVQNSDDVHTNDARYARDEGYGVHHDWMGWYIIAPYEREPRTGCSLGFDGRPHFNLCTDAWTRAATLAKRRASRRAA